MLWVLKRTISMRPKTKVLSMIKDKKLLTLKDFSYLDQWLKYGP